MTSDEGSLGRSNDSLPTPAAPKAASSPSIHEGSLYIADIEEGRSRSPMMSSSSSSSSEVDEKSKPRSNTRSQRPKPQNRKSSGTLIVSSDDPNIEADDEEYEPGDARAMSPRRTSEEVDKLEESARQALMEQAKALQASLLQILDRVESVKSEQEKLEGGNQFLQSYIGELMQTSKLTAAGGSKAKGKGRSAK